MTRREYHPVQGAYASPPDNDPFLASLQAEVRRQANPGLFGDPVFESREVGQRAATRVRVTNHHSFYNGRIGVIVRVDHVGSIAVRLPVGDSAVTLPFAAIELQRA